MKDIRIGDSQRAVMLPVFSGQSATPRCVRAEIANVEPEEIKLGPNHQNSRSRRGGWESEDEAWRARRLLRSPAWTTGRRAPVRWVPRGARGD